MILKRVLRVALSLVVGFGIVTTPFMSETVLPKLGIEKIDVISQATGGGGGGLNPIDPTEQEDKDKSHWYKIFIPYKYLEPGLNDVYFYMDDITYKVALELGDEFSKEKIAPKLIALENTDGVNVELKLKMVHEGEAERKDYYGIIRESLNKNVSIIEMFTMGNLNTV